jgi:hypothetical protein
MEGLSQLPPNLKLRLRAFQSNHILSIPVPSTFRKCFSLGPRHKTLQPRLCHGFQRDTPRLHFPPHLSNRSTLLPSHGRHTRRIMHSTPLRLSRFRCLGQTPSLPLIARTTRTQQPFYLYRGNGLFAEEGEWEDLGQAKRPRRHRRDSPSDGRPWGDYCCFAPLPRCDDDVSARGLGILRIRDATHRSYEGTDTASWDASSAQRHRFRA